MDPENSRSERTDPTPGSEQVRKLTRLSDPELSELELDELLDELLDRVYEALDVDTVELEASSSESVVTVAVRDNGRWRPPWSGDRGRGLTIIESAMDDVDINPAPAGTEVVMRRRLERR